MPWLIVLLGYFLGSIPTAYAAGRLLKGRDIGWDDGNLGAAHAFRQLCPVYPATTGMLVAGPSRGAHQLQHCSALPSGHYPFRQEKTISSHSEHVKASLGVTQVSLSEIMVKLRVDGWL